MVKTLDMRPWQRVEAVSNKPSVDGYNSKALGIECGVDVAPEADGIGRMLHPIHCSGICVTNHSVLVEPFSFRSRNQVSILHRIVTLCEPTVGVGRRRRLQLLGEVQNLSPVGRKCRGKSPVLKVGNDRVVYDLA